MRKLGGVTAVYTWVDQSCPVFQKNLHDFSETERDRNPERYRDDWELFRYSLRSLHAYCPWVDEVCLFTARPQVPTWLSRDKVQLVHHDEVIDARYLPTFSTRTIESFFHKLPLNTPWFLAMQDDWLFTREVPPGAFWKEDGRVKIYGTYLGEHHRRLCFDSPHLPGRDHLEHMPRLARQEWWSEMIRWLPEDIERTRSHRFRRKGDLRMDRLYCNFLLGHRKSEVSAVCCLQNLRVHSFVKLLNDVSRVEQCIKNLRNKRPPFLCLNDDLGSNPSLQVQGVVHSFLQELFPEPSPFEINEGELGVPQGVKL